MPFATFSKIREVSSEDSVNLAENLISNQLGKKWKTKNAGEKSAFVILEMSDFHQITGIDIGNEHSAFIEVLVGKSSCAPEDFTEILITCSFMTPIESKSSINPNRVRCFNLEALVPAVVEDSWSLLKVICTQPFNKHVSYGLSFIKVHVNQKPKRNMKNIVPDRLINEAAEISFVSGKLKFREDSPDSEGESSSNLFSRWKKLKKDGEGVQTVATSVKDSMKVLDPPGDDQKPQTSKSAKMNDILDRNRDKLLYGDENDDNNENQAKQKRLLKHIEIDKERRRLELEIEMKKKKRKSLDRTEVSEKHNISEEHKKNCKTDNNSNTDTSSNLVKKRQSSPPEKSNKKIKTIEKTLRPFNQLLKGVVLVISGIQNPDRENLRNKALALGAKYKGDWDNTCTHLICAFKNTPKYNQVKGKGKIVTRSWIEKCYSSKKFLPWRRYALDSKELSKPESEEEIFDETMHSQDKETNVTVLLKKSEAEFDDRKNILALYDIDDLQRPNMMGNNNTQSSSENDTDDEIERIEEIKRTTLKTLDIYEASTDEEEYLQEKLNLVNRN